MQLKLVDKKILKNSLEKSDCLDLTGLNLKEIPRSVFDLSHLKVLKLMYNEIDKIPDEILNLRELTHLYLYHNKFKEIPVSLLNEIPFLTCIDFAENNVDPFQISDFYKNQEKWANFRDISIEVRKIRPTDKHFSFYQFGEDEFSIPIELFGNTQLESISIHANVREIPDEISKLKNLKSLNLSNNKISKLPASFFELKRLEDINLDINNFKEFPTELLELPKIIYLTFNHNSITKIKDSLDNVVHNKDYRAFGFFGNPLEDFNYDKEGYWDLNYIKEEIYSLAK